LITTKRGRSGKAVIDLTFFTGVSNCYQSLDFNECRQEFAEELFFFAEGVDPNQPNLFTTTQRNWKHYAKSGGEDWQSRLFHKRIYKKHAAFRKWW